MTSANLNCNHRDFCCVIPPYISRKIDEAYPKPTDRKFLPQDEAINVLRKQRGVEHPGPVISEILDMSEPSRIEFYNVTTDTPLSLPLGPQESTRKCFEHMQKIDQFSRYILGVYPVQNRGRVMRAVFNDRELNDNAAWSALKESMHFAPPSQVFTPFENNMDIVAHEFGHAVVQYSNDLHYHGESGALSEHLADIFAITLKHFITQKNSENASWVLGEGLHINAPHSGLRSLKDPGSAFDYCIRTAHGLVEMKDDQVKDYKYCVTTFDDFGGVHKYCGIPNHAFYLLATSNAGNSWEKPLQIWNLARRNGLKNDDFKTFANRTIAAAKTLGYSEGVQSLVHDAWRKVGVPVENSTSLITRENSGQFSGWSVGGASLTGVIIGFFTSQAFKK